MYKTKIHYFVTVLDMFYKETLLDINRYQHEKLETWIIHKNYSSERLLHNIALVRTYDDMQLSYNLDLVELPSYELLRGREPLWRYKFCAVVGRVTEHPMIYQWSNGSFVFPPVNETRKTSG